MQTLLDFFHYCWSHEFVAMLAQFLGQRLGGDAVQWLHPVFHVVLVWVPIALFVLLARFLWQHTTSVRRQFGQVLTSGSNPDRLPPGVFAFVVKFSGREQLFLVVAGLVSMPILYLTLELPKIIINSVISPDAGMVNFPMRDLHFGVEVDQIGHLILFCLLYLVAVALGAGIKFGINLFKGRLAERLLRRLRLTVFQKWRNGQGGARKTEAIPLIAQEVEPIGGFASDAFARPVFEGGTFLTIVTFMFVQNPILGMAALALLPVQLALIPWFQRRINALARERVREIRALGGHLGVQAGEAGRSAEHVFVTAGTFRKLEALRWRLYKWKFGMKGLNSILTALTPFFFYSVGGYLVIEGNLSLGALVAILAAYKDFSTPLRELFKYYQTMEDVRVRYDELRGYFGQAGSDVVNSLTTSPSGVLREQTALQSV